MHYHCCEVYTDKYDHPFKFGFNASIATQDRLRRVGVRIVAGFEFGGCHVL